MVVDPPGLGSSRAKDYFVDLQIDYRSTPLVTVLDAVVHAVDARLRPLMLGVGLVVLRTRWGGEYRASTANVGTLERLQSPPDGGPAFAAIAARRAIVIFDFSLRSHWPKLVGAAKVMGVTSIMAIPLKRAEPVGAALTLYLDARPPADLLSEIRFIVDHAGVVVGNAVAFARFEIVASHLQAALESRDLIGQAKGVLMARRGLGAEEAFALLREASQHENRKLRDVASDFLTKECQLPSLGEPERPTQPSSCSALTSEKRRRSVNCMAREKMGAQPPQPPEGYFREEA